MKRVKCRKNYFSIKHKNKTLFHKKILFKIKLEFWTKNYYKNRKIVKDCLKVKKMRKVNLKIWMNLNRISNRKLLFLKNIFSQYNNWQHNYRKLTIWSIVFNKKLLHFKNKSANSEAQIINNGEKTKRTKTKKECLGSLVDDHWYLF